MMDVAIFGAPEYALRVVGRIGFVLLLVILYRLYKLIASPLLRKRNRKFIILFSLSLIISFAFVIMEYLFPAIWSTYISTSFNVATTWILVIYLYKQVTRLENSSSSLEFFHLRESMDAAIYSLKNRK